MTGWFGALFVALFVLGAAAPGKGARDLIAVAGVIALGAVVAEFVRYWYDVQARRGRRCKKHLPEFGLRRCEVWSTCWQRCQNPALCPLQARPKRRLTRRIWVLRSNPDVRASTYNREEGGQRWSGKRSAGAATPAPMTRLESRSSNTHLVAQVSRQVKNFDPPPLPSFAPGPLPSLSHI